MPLMFPTLAVQHDANVSHRMVWRALMAPKSEKRHAQCCKHRCPFWLFWFKNRGPWFTWWFNQLPGPSISPKTTPMVARPVDKTSKNCNPLCPLASWIAAGLGVCGVLKNGPFCLVVLVGTPHGRPPIWGPTLHASIKGSAFAGVFSRCQV